MMRLPKDDLDIIFISYRESNAEQNWLDLKARFPRAKRLHGIKGIAEAHRQAAELSQSEHFFVVDGDNRILPSFDFAAPSSELRTDTLYVWRCRNPINDLTYGFGAIKLYNKQLIAKRRSQPFVDLATSVAERYQVVPVPASETHFFVTPFEAWRGAFRECAKLASQQLRGQKSQETLERLQVWQTKFHPLENWEWVQRGALDGTAFAKSPNETLESINSFDWLGEVYRARYT